MPGSTEVLKRMLKDSNGAYSDFEYVPNSTETDLMIDCGVLFLMAFWSGPAVMGFKNLCESLHAIELPSGFLFRVLDWDGATHFLDRLSQHDLIIGGNAEAFWFRKGKIIAATHVGTSSPERIMKIIDRLAQS
ncbi:hypothetical protein [Prosthecobacter fluviatilis]|uniref:Uncharacterized protein n=1 Tax=Prosthecobacter fluviatilis TaxID=445931 RepID=A0ABW0KLH1_9BACT